jgi:hypothetical protein
MPHHIHHIMKHPALIPSLCAIFGFLLAWFVKPGTSSTPEAPTPSSQSASAHTTTLDGSTRPNPTKSRFDPLTQTEDGTPLPPEIIAARTQLANAARNSLDLKDQGLVQRLTELLGLNAEQQQQLLHLYQTKRDQLNIYSPGASLNPQRILEEAETVEKRFNDSLAQILSSEQIEQLNTFRKQQAANQSLASAQKEYADVLEKIDLSPDQQAAVLQSLQQNSANSQKLVLDKTGLFAETFDAMGFGSVGDAMSLVAAANSAINQSSDKAALVAGIVEARKTETARKLEALHGILTPAQYAQYASLVEGRDQTFYRQFAPLLQAPPPEELLQK